MSSIARRKINSSNSFDVALPSWERFTSRSAPAQYPFVSLAQDRRTMGNLVVVDRRTLQQSKTRITLRRWAPNGRFVSAITWDPRDGSRNVADRDYIATAKRMKADGHAGKDIAKYLGVSRALVRTTSPGQFSSISPTSHQHLLVKLPPWHRSVAAHAGMAAPMCRCFIGSTANSPRPHSRISLRPRSSRSWSRSSGLLLGLGRELDVELPLAEIALRNLAEGLGVPHTTATESL